MYTMIWDVPRILVVVCLCRLYLCGLLGFYCFGLCLDIVVVGLILVG